jgi:hypothetical protein
MRNAMNSLRDLLDCFDADDLGDALLFVLACIGIVAMANGWI